MFKILVPMVICFIAVGKTLWFEIRPVMKISYTGEESSESSELPPASPELSSSPVVPTPWTVPPAISTPPFLSPTSAPGSDPLSENGDQVGCKVNQSETIPINDPPGIVDGEVVKITDSHSQVAMIDNDSKKILCGGTIISPYWILTAGSCLHDGDKVAVTKFHVGSYSNLYTETREQNINKTWCYPNYTWHDSDIAMIQVNSSLDLIDANQKSILCSKYSGQNFTAHTAVLTGWSSNSSISNVLRHVPLKIISGDWCNRLLKARDLKPIEYTSFCAKPITKDSAACDIYRGSQLTVGNILIGVLSLVDRNKGECDTGAILQFCDVWYYKDHWISAIMDFVLHPRSKSNTFENWLNSANTSGKNV